MKINKQLLLSATLTLFFLATETPLTASFSSDVSTILAKVSPGQIVRDIKRGSLSMHNIERVAENVKYGKAQMNDTAILFACSGLASSIIGAGTFIQGTTQLKDKTPEGVKKMVYGIGGIMFGLWLYNEFSPHMFVERTFAEKVMEAFDANRR